MPYVVTVGLATQNKTQPTLVSLPTGQAAKLPSCLLLGSHFVKVGAKIKTQLIFYTLEKKMPKHVNALGRCISSSSN